MKLAIHFKGTDRSPSLIEDVQASVSRLRVRHVDRLIVRFEDVNGPKGGLDKRCSISMRGSFGTCVVQTFDADFFIGAERALELCERLLERAINGHRRERLSFGPAFAEAAS